MTWLQHLISIWRNVRKTKIRSWYLHLRHPCMHPTLPTPTLGNIAVDWGFNNSAKSCNLFWPFKSTATRSARYFFLKVVHLWKLVSPYGCTQVPQVPEKRFKSKLTVNKAENPEQGNTRCQRRPPIHVASPVLHSATKRRKVKPSRLWCGQVPSCDFLWLMPKH